MASINMDLKFECLRLQFFIEEDTLPSLTTSMECSPPSDLDICSTGQWIPHIFWNLRGLYHIQNTLLLLSVLNQMHPVHFCHLPFSLVSLRLIVMPVHLWVGFPSSSLHITPNILYVNFCSVACMPHAFCMFSPWICSPDNIRLGVQNEKRFRISFV